MKLKKRFRKDLSSTASSLIPKLINSLKREKPRDIKEKADIEEKRKKAVAKNRTVTPPILELIENSPKNLNHDYDNTVSYITANVSDISETSSIRMDSPLSLNHNCIETVSDTNAIDSEILVYEMKTSNEVEGETNIGSISSSIVTIERSEIDTQLEWLEELSSQYRKQSCTNSLAKTKIISVLQEEKEIKNESEVLEQQRNHASIATVQSLFEKSFQIASLFEQRMVQLLEQFIKKRRKYKSYYFNNGNRLYLSSSTAAVFAIKSIKAFLFIIGLRYSTPVTTRNAGVEPMGLTGVLHCLVIFSFLVLNQSSKRKFNHYLHD